MALSESARAATRDADGSPLEFVKLGGLCVPDTTSLEPKQDVREVREALLRDFVFEALSPVESDSAAARLCLRNDDDVGARYHLKRIVECVKAAASTFRELEAMKAAPADARAA
jgi:hypothetical protein